nr:MAG TPA: hypothetical protein [Caudoviricetes sp.]
MDNTPYLVYSTFTFMFFPQWGQVRERLSFFGCSNNSEISHSIALAIRSNTSIDGLPFIC